MANSAAWMSLPDIFTLKTVVPLYLMGAATEICSWTILHYVWVGILQLPYPIPFVLHVNLIFFVFPATIVAIWFKFPNSWRKNSVFRHRLLYLLQAHFYVAFFMTLKYAIFTVAFVYIPSEYQWVLVLLLIFAREIGQFILNKICSKMIENSEKRDDSIELVNTHLGKTWNFPKIPVLTFPLTLAEYPFIGWIYKNIQMVYIIEDDSRDL